MSVNQRNVYLQMKPLSEALDIVLQAFGASAGVATELVDAPDAVGRVLAEPVAARLSSPNYHAAAMDGIAVTAADTFGAHESRPRQLTVGSEAFFVNTGHVLPPDTDAVIMIENVQVIDDDHVQIEAPVFPWQHVRKMGEDIVATEMLFPRQHVVTPYCVGALLSAGVFKVAVRRRPRVMIIPTGSELVDWRDLGPEAIRPGQVIESNSYLLGKLVEGVGGAYQRVEKVVDDLDVIGAAVTSAIAQGADIVMLVGGSSAGSEDYSRAVIARHGKVLVHGVTMMPGKPVIVGDVNGTPVFGMPGYPVSTIMAFEQLVQPLMAAMLGQPHRKRPTADVWLTRKLASKLGVEEFVRVKIGKVGDRLVATPLPRGAGQITSITQADGIIRVPSHIEGYRDDAPVPAELLRSEAAIINSILAVGSHDNTVDVLADEMCAQSAGLSLTSSHVGSLGGIMAVKRGVCHMAGTHLLDEADGSYNLSYIRKYLADMPVRLVHLVMRDQGLMVPPGNPKGVRGIEDLVREDIQLINRQGGSGTRILLDFKLKELGLDAGRIAGYEREEFTHMAVAVAVLSGAADVGLGIYAAAKALGLEFIPVVTEQYDLVMPMTFFEMPAIQAMMNVINSQRFQARVEALGGYHVSRTGKILL